jgi:hypothetical protein
MMWPLCTLAIPADSWPAVLEGVQREVGETGDVVLRGVDPEDAALVTRSVAFVEVEAGL